MQTTSDCLSCFLKQAKHTAHICKTTSALREKIINAVTEEFFPIVDFEKSPPENAIKFYDLIASLTGCPDPYTEIKKESNRFAMSIASDVRKKIDEAPDPLSAALRFSIAGNIIDYGAQHKFDMEQIIYESLQHRLAVDHISEFYSDLQQASTILYLGDNSGEIVFDGIVIEKLRKNVTFAVRDRAIINDALLTDAKVCGLDKICRIISNGTGCPGTPLQHCSDEFRQLFHSVDLIISKGQGNFETLSEIEAPIYFLLTIKCQVVNDHLFAATKKPTDWPKRLPFPVLLKSPHFRSNKR